MGAWPEGDVGSSGSVAVHSRFHSNLHRYTLDGLCPFPHDIALFTLPAFPFSSRGWKAVLIGLLSLLPRRDATRPDTSNRRADDLTVPLAAALMFLCRHTQSV